MTEKINKYVIIVAGGKGERMAAELPKQFMLLDGLPVLMHTIQAFHRYDETIKIILVLPKQHHITWNNLCEKHNFSLKHQVVYGGETRFHSVRNALLCVQGNDAIVGVHDGVRPLVSDKLIQRCYKAVEEYLAVIPVIPVFDSLRELDILGNSKPVDRQCFRAVQTPQVFRSDILKRAYSTEYLPEFTDDASVIERICNIHIIEGDRKNIKITVYEDLLVAEAFLSSDN